MYHLFHLKLTELNIFLYEFKISNFNLLKKFNCKLLALMHERLWISVKIYY
jgi:hypothetical protein